MCGRVCRDGHAAFCVVESALYSTAALRLIVQAVGELVTPRRAYQGRVRPHDRPWRVCRVMCPCKQRGSNE